MAGDWIKVECTTPDKPEVFQIAERLDMAPEHVFGCLVALWIWADEQTIDGNASGVTRALVQRKTGVAGFADAMIEVGWLEEGDGGLSFPNFERHNGKTAKNRALTAKRAAKHRAVSNADSNADRNGAGVTSASPREEKRREEKENPLVDSGEPTDKDPGEKTPAQKYTPEFESLWQEYPKRAGGNPKWGAYKAYRARLRNGATHQEILEGLRRYKAYLTARGNVGTEFVQQGSKFFGPDEGFREEWAISDGVPTEEPPDPDLFSDPERKREAARRKLAWLNAKPKQSHAGVSW